MLSIRLIRLLTLSAALAAVASAFPVNTAVTVQRDSPLFPYGSEATWGYVGRPDSSIAATRSGIFGLKASENANGPFTPFEAICIDANEYLFQTSQLYYIESLDDFTAIPTYTPSSLPPLDANQRKLLGQLFTVGWNDVRNTADVALRATRSSAFQWAAWNIGRDTDMTLASGPVRLTTGDSTHQAVLAEADRYLAAIQSNTDVASLQIWSPVRTVTGPNGTFFYERVWGQELLVFTPTPEPGFYGMLAVGLGGVVLAARRRRKSAVPGEQQSDSR